LSKGRNFLAGTREDWQKNINSRIVALTATAGKTIKEKGKKEKKICVLREQER